MITRDLECPSHDNCIFCSYDVTGADFENSLHAFGQSEKSERVQCIVIFVIIFIFIFAMSVFLEDISFLATL